MTAAVITTVTDGHKRVEIAGQRVRTSDTTGVLTPPVVPKGSRVVVAGKTIITSTTVFKVAKTGCSGEGLIVASNWGLAPRQFENITRIVQGGPRIKVHRPRVHASFDFQFIAHPVSVCVVHTVPIAIVGSLGVGTCPVVEVHFRIKIACTGVVAGWFRCMEFVHAT